jgi:Kef-type K+ transport system membrane component KefB
MSNGQAKIEAAAERAQKAGTAEPNRWGVMRMNNIETIICLILVLTAVPDLCRKLGRPALANVFFVLFGFGLEPYLEKDVVTMIGQAGEVGFLLVLFEVGLEIDLPKLRDFLPALRFAVIWSMVQYPVVLELGFLAGLSVPDAILAAAALTSCSLSMAYLGWKHYPGLPGASRGFVVQIMIALEVLAILILSVGSVGSDHGSGWLILFKLAGMAVTVYLIGRFAAHMVKMFQWIIEKTSRWRVHFLVLLLLVISAIGERLGLAAPKTAFFLGLFMSKAEFAGKSVEEYISPISHGFLIPVFFVSLGLLIDSHSLFSFTAFLAVVTALVLIGCREVLHRRWLKTGGDVKAYLLLCPNLTMAALAGKTFLASGNRGAAAWVVLTGLFISVISLFMLPRVAEEPAAVKREITVPLTEKAG